MPYSIRVLSFSGEVYHESTFFDSARVGDVLAGVKSESWQQVHLLQGRCKGKGASASVFVCCFGVKKVNS